MKPLTVANFAGLITMREEVKFKLLRCKGASWGDYPTLGSIVKERIIKLEALYKRIQDEIDNRINSQL